MDYLRNRIPNSIFLAPVTEREIEIIIESLNQKKAIGPYSIPVFLLKILCRYIAVPLSKIVNQSFWNWYISRLFENWQSKSSSQEGFL